MDQTKALGNVQNEDKQDNFQKPPMVQSKGSRLQTRLRLEAARITDRRQTTTGNSHNYSKYKR